MGFYLIDPDETLDYSCNWAEFLDVGSPTDSISTSVWAVTPLELSPVVPVLSSPSTIGDLTTTFISQCIRGRIYQLTNTITTAQGRTADRSLTIRCDHR